MRRAALRVGVLCVAACLAGGLAARGATVALLEVRNQAGDDHAAALVGESLWLALAEKGDLVEPQRTRDARRRLRIRSSSQVSSQQLRELSTELGADWLVSATLHDVAREDVPSLTLSLRAYEAVTGQLVWIGFDGASGLDRRKVLGLGVVTEVETLVPPLVERLLGGLSFEAIRNGVQVAPGASVAGADIGPVALVPLLAVTEQRATATAETVTEAVRAALFGLGIPIVSPNCTSDTLRRHGAVLWGGVDADTRSALHRECGAATLLTGSVEAFDLFVVGGMPEPELTMALRLVDARTGRILWMGDIERHGFDGVNLFGIGRVYSLGGLTGRVTRRLLERLRHDDGVWASRIREAR